MKDNQRDIKSLSLSLKLQGIGFFLFYYCSQLFRLDLGFYTYDEASELGNECILPVRYCITVVAGVTSTDLCMLPAEPRD